MPCDCHIHMILDGVFYRDAIDHQKKEPDEALIRSRLLSYAAHGVTFLRDGGDAWGVGLRAAQLAHEYGIDYRSPAFPIYCCGHYGGFIGRGFEDIKGYRNLIAEARALGADFIKIMISGLMDFDRYGVITGETYSAELIAEMIRIAHGEGFAVMAHANGAGTLRIAAEAGVDSIEHGAYADDAALSAMAAHNVIWTPTLSTIGNLIGCGRYRDDVLSPLLETQSKSLRKYATMGGLIACGSDAGAYLVPHVQGAADEERYLVRALGDDAGVLLQRGEAEIKRRFKRNQYSRSTSSVMPGFMPCVSLSTRGSSE